MLNCKEVARLLSESLDHKLPFRKRMNLYMHFFMCKACDTYCKQIKAIEKNLRHYFKNMPEVSTKCGEDAHLPEEAKKRIKSSLSDPS